MKEFTGRVAILLMLLLVLIAFNLVVASSATKTIPGLLLPHGDFAWDPTLISEPNRQVAEEVALASRLAAAVFWNDNNTAGLDTILLVTPHGIQLENEFGLYLAHSGSGTAIIGHDLIPPVNDYNISISHLPMDLNASQQLLQFLQQSHHNVTGIYPPDDASCSSSSSSSIPLNWGEIIPLKLLLPRNVNRRVKFMILSLPHRRYDHASEMVPELLKLGESIGDWILLPPTNTNNNSSSNKNTSNDKNKNKSKETTTTTTTTITKNIGVVISGDLSHTHQASGPYGYSPTGSLFDHAMGIWAKDPCHSESQLLVTARQLQPAALSCGFTGYVIWQGILRSQWKTRLGRYYCKKSSCSSLVQKSATVPETILLNGNHQENGNVSTSHRTLRRPLQSHYHSRHESTRTNGPVLHSTLHVNKNVTYYGMMAATFLWKEIRHDKETRGVSLL